MTDTKHTDSVEAVTQEAVFIHQAFQRAKPHDYHKPFEETDQEYQRVMKSIASELIARNQQQVEEAARKARTDMFGAIKGDIELLQYDTDGDTFKKIVLSRMSSLAWFEALTPNHQN